MRARRRAARNRRAGERHEGRSRAGVPLDRLDDLPFRAADIVDEHIGRRGFGSAENVFGDAIYGCADNHEIGFGDGRFEVDRGAVDGPGLNGLVERDLIATDPDHVRGDPPRRSASPIDPPISPTPMMTAVPKRFNE